MNTSENTRRKTVWGLLIYLFNKLSVGQKIMTVIVVEIMSYSIITGIALYQIHLMGNEIRQMANLYIPLLSATASIRHNVQGERLYFKDIVVSGDRVVYDKEAEDEYILARTRYRSANAKINELISYSEQMVLNAVEDDKDNTPILQLFAPKLLRELTKIRDAQVQTTIRVDEIFGHVEEGSFLMGMELVEGVRVSEGVLLAELDNLERDLQGLKAASVDYAANAERASSRMTIFASIVTVCVVVLIFFLMVKRHIAKPLHVLTDAIKTFDPMKPAEEGLRNGDQSKLMSRGDELGMVARSLRELKQTLRLQGQALKQAKEKAEQADRAKTRFLAAASHDLRQPLYAMQMYIAVLRQRIHDDETLAIVDDVQEVSIATGRLLNSLLDVSQLEAGAIKPQFEDFSVQELLDRVAISFTPLASRKGLTVRVVPTRSFVHSDPVLMERIIGNLLSNAIRYTDKGKILLGSRRRGDMIAIHVLDTGHGIPKDQSNAIFDDFHQLDNDERDRSKGLGLGLAIVRRLAECLNHKVELRSTIGKGSNFCVVVAKAEPKDCRAKRDEGSEAADAVHDLTGFNVLLIEDDAAVADATLLLLQSWKCKAYCVRTPEEALAYLEAQNVVPDIVLADYRLPGDLDGVEAIQRIQLALQVAVPGIIITGESDIGAIREIDRMGYMILRKPVRPARLRRLIGHYVKQASVG